jgi:hypothetical protein
MHTGVTSRAVEATFTTPSVPQKKKRKNKVTLTKVLSTVLFKKIIKKIKKKKNV